MTRTYYSDPLGWKFNLQDIPKEGRPLRMSHDATIEHFKKRGDELKSYISKVNGAFGETAYYWTVHMRRFQISWLNAHKYFYPELYL